MHCRLGPGARCWKRGIEIARLESGFRLLVHVQGTYSIIAHKADVRKEQTASRPLTTLNRHVVICLVSSRCCATNA